MPCAMLLTVTQAKHILSNIEIKILFVLFIECLFIISLSVISKSFFSPVNVYSMFGEKVVMTLYVVDFLCYKLCLI